MHPPPIFLVSIRGKRRIRTKGEIICYWCRKPVPEKRIAKCAKVRPPKFCSRGCFLADHHENNLISGFYVEFSKAGNDAQARYQRLTGTRLGHEKRLENVQKAGAARWKK